MHDPTLTIEAMIFDAYGTLFDTQSVLPTLEKAFPGRGEYLTQIWRLKQLEYSWLRSLADDYRGFDVVTRDALRYSLTTIGIEIGASSLDSLARAYDCLDLYGDALAMLTGLTGRRLAVFSNGTTAMLEALLASAGIRERFERVVSVDAVRVFKPSPRTYRLACATLGLPPQKVLLVSSNGFDLHGGALYGLQTARVERNAADAVWVSSGARDFIRPPAYFSALRSQLEVLGSHPTITVRSLTDLIDAVGH